MSIDPADYWMTPDEERKMEEKHAAKNTPKKDYTGQIEKANKEIESLVSKRFKLQRQMSNIDCKISKAYDSMFA